jgi:hypothetical protein
MKSTTSHRIECYLRGDTYGTYERQQAVVERVGALESADVIADASVEADEWLQQFRSLSVGRAEPHLDPVGV